MASGNTITIKKDNYEELVINSSLPVLIDFWAVWCGPCKAIAPVIDELAEEYKDRFIIGKSNVDDESDLAQKFNIMSIPTLVVIKNGQEAERVVGARSKADLKLLMDKYV